MNPILYIVKSAALPSLIAGAAIAYLQTSEFSVLGTLLFTGIMILLPLSIGVVIAWIYCQIRKSGFTAGLNIAFCICWAILLVSNVIAAM